MSSVSLRDKNKSALLIVDMQKGVLGAQTEACVRSTIHGAFTRGYDVTQISDAHTTEDLTQYGLPKPETLISFTNVYWGFQSAPDRAAAVVKTAEAQFQILFLV